MKSRTISPKIKSFKWGEIETEHNTYRDAKLFPGGSSTWDWNETDTHHVPGIQPADVKKLLERHAQIIILSKGIDERLQTMDETKQLLQDRGLTYFILQSEKAVQKYNHLRQNKAVGALIHSTC